MSFVIAQVMAIGSKFFTAKIIEAIVVALVREGVKRSASKLDDAILAEIDKKLEN